MYSLLKYYKRASQVSSSNLLASMAKHTLIWLFMFVFAFSVRILMLTTVLKRCRHEPHQPPCFRLRRSERDVPASRT